MSTPLLVFPPGCRKARFLGREKRFTVHVELDGTPTAAHTNNTGSMLGLLRPGHAVLLSPAQTQGRKLPFTLELARFPDFRSWDGQGPGFWTGVNTATPNRMLQAAWSAGRLPELAGRDSLRREATVGESRLDALASGPAGEVWIEAKNVTLVEDGVALFPDAPTERGRKHLRELTRLAGQGLTAALFFLIQRPDASCFAPATVIDPDYADLFLRAVAAGVQVWPYVARISEAGIDLGARLPLVPVS